MSRRLHKSMESSFVSDVAQMKRFFAYEEYGAKYDLMIHDVASTYKAIPLWHAYEKGIEALASSITSINSRAAQERKGLTFGDLLIKVRLHSVDIAACVELAISLSNACASIRSCSRTWSSRLRSATAQNLTQSSRRYCTDFEKRLVRSTRLRTTHILARKSRRRGICRIDYSSPNRYDLGPLLKGISIPT